MKVFEFIGLPIQLYIECRFFFSVHYDVLICVHIFPRIHNIHVVYGQIHLFHAKCVVLLLRQ